ncbi:Hg(II)-responsive transcriptional regulator [Peribacillus loiseleuriae]|uniref:Mercuric resistance operon regulatory protein n=1 Tax=Peribacillus loiseleuriae TaxID=1679170 RepID=A0A0K9GTS7_9BACI|nr:Hg(II)-responsive transcriptional regulator [Peribacillus loiseleuriae]KMY50089.1 MerR family transcriptional regulator [Peribacillus loiseleuriae]KMY50093.1 MerR family transcriptional regulator [Peribacillus loiseleuriae]
MRYRISELAEKCSVNKETIRYYERVGLLSKPSRTNAGYRIYPEETVHRMQFIKRMQDLGFSLAEIDKLLGVVDKDNERCMDMYDFLNQKVDEVQKKISDFKRIERMLINLKECCPDEKSLYECPIIDILMNEEKNSKM